MTVPDTVQAPLVWNRHIYLPEDLPATAESDTDTTASSSSTTTTSELRLNWHRGHGHVHLSSPPSPPTAARLRLPLTDLRHLMASLLALLPAGVLLGASAHTDGGRGDDVLPRPGSGGFGYSGPRRPPGPWLGPSTVQLRYHPLAVGGNRDISAGSRGAPALTGTTPLSPSSSPSLIQDAPEEPSDYEIRWLASVDAARGSTAQHSASASGGTQRYVQARLNASHIAALVNIYDDVSGRFPGLLPVPPLPTATQPAAAALSGGGGGGERYGGGGATGPGAWLRAAAGFGVGAAGVIALVVACGPLAGLIRGGRSTELAHPSATANTPVGSSAAGRNGGGSGRHSGSASSSRGLQPAGLLGQWDDDALRSACAAVHRAAHQRMWLPLGSGDKDTTGGNSGSDVKVADKEGAQAVAELGNAACSPQVQPLVLTYQVVVSR